jgi:hypothetical protein
MAWAMAAIHAGSASRRTHRRVRPAMRSPRPSRTRAAKETDG